MENIYRIIESGILKLNWQWLMKLYSLLLRIWTDYKTHCFVKSPDWLNYKYDIYTG